MVLIIHRNGYVVQNSICIIPQMSASTLESYTGTCYTEPKQIDLTCGFPFFRKVSSVSRKGKEVRAMRMKKLLTAVMTTALVFSLFAMPVSAHGHGNGHHGHRGYQGNSSATNPDTDDIITWNTECPVCTVDSCLLDGRHFHDGHEYCGYDHKGDYCDGTCEAYCTKYGSERGCGTGRRAHCR